VKRSVEVEIGFRPQPGPQQAFIECPADIVIYGGARGGGKSFAALGDFWLHAEEFGAHARGLMIRRHRVDLKDTIVVAQRLYGSAATWREHGSYFLFEGGGRLDMAYLESEADAASFQGWSLSRVYVEELTQLSSPDPVMALLATLRSAHGVPCQMKCTCNPGGPGHHWVKAWAIDPGAYRMVVDPDTGLSRVFIPAKVSDNPKLLEADPRYIDRLRSVGSQQRVRAWLEGDWSVIEGAFFNEWDPKRHVITPFHVPDTWTKYRSLDWGSAVPFSVGWWTVVQDDLEHDGRILPRNAIVQYREWYGMLPGRPNVGLKLTAQEVAAGIISRETNPESGKREHVSFGIIDPAAFAVISGPSIAETLLRQGVAFRRADNTRRSTDKRVGGWDQVRHRLKGGDEGRPLIYVFNTCREIIRTLPIMQHDGNQPEDLDTDLEDHAVDQTRYACMARPYRANISDDLHSKSPWLVANAFRLHELRD
jgi:hypothetical protein